ncbi:MAG: phosphoribosylanthranilate isomerase [Phormidesmis sp. CAN_BIN36]|nr:phosphoribosylanthranilate isomerase [Phormidesmis sp. CAN_BIN36]
MSLRVKICGITQADQGRAIAHLGATALGFICVAGTPRYVSPQQIRAMVDQLPKDLTTGEPIDRVGVFLNASLLEICQTVAIAGLNSVQLHGSESPEFCHKLRIALPDVELIKALRIKDPKALSQADFYQGCVDALLLDAYHPTLSGGTGETLNWSTLRSFRPTYPWLLAGGLNSENVLDALEASTPDGIDLSSGVENAPGDKNLEQVAKLFEQLRFTL